MILRKAIRGGLYVAGARTLFFIGMFGFGLLLKSKNLLVLLSFLHFYDWVLVKEIQSDLFLLENNETMEVFLWGLFVFLDTFLVGFILFFIALSFRALNEWRQK
jgi:hypothetical protein